MSNPTHIQLHPCLIQPTAPIYRDILQWPVAPFFTRIARDDIPTRFNYGSCHAYAYYDYNNPETYERIPVGFGSLDLCDDWGDFTDQKEHFYIPLLAKNPDIARKGYGSSILDHLIGQAAAMILLHRNAGSDLHHSLLLDVYMSSEDAIKLYNRFGFTSLTPRPLQDADQNNDLFIVMAKRII